MKKNLFFMMAAGAMLFATSCQNDLDIMGNVGDEALVSFTVTTPEIATRAYSDGTTATHLQYAVYNADGDLLDDLTVTDGEIHGSETVNLQLTTGNTYSVIFWAAAPNAPYAVDFATQTMTVDYANALSNDENRDAFYKYHTFTVNGAQTETIELKRPFAQLNIGTADYAASASAGYTPTLSSVKVSNVYTTLDLVEGNVATPVEVAFAEAVINKGEIFPVNDAVYDYLAMNYLLVAKDKETVDIEFAYAESETATPKTRTVGSVPVQRNYRTNIYGNLLTSNVDINVEIKPAYDGELESDAIMVNNANELQAALNAAPVGETTTISLAKEIEGDVIEFQKADRHIVILGCGNKYDGTIKIHTGSNYNNGSITIKDVKFETSTASLNFIMPNDFGVENGVTRRYSQNVVVDGCTFTATGDAVNTAVGVQAKSCNNVQVIGCEATGMHSLIQAQSCGTDVIVKDCTINGKNGVAFKQVRNAVVEGSTIVAAEYGIRFDGNTANYGIIAKDINVTANQPFIVRKMIGANNTIELQGNNTLVSGETYQIVITNGSDDATYSTPTGTYTLTGADNFNVYPRDAADYAMVTTAADLNAALANADIKTIELGAGEFGTIVAKSNKTIIGSANAKVDCVNLNGADNVTLKNIKFDAATAKLGYDGGGKAKQYANIISGDNVNKPTKGALNIVVDGCTFAGTFAKGGAAIAFTDQTRSGGGSGNVTIKNCTFDTEGAYYDIYGHYTGNGSNGYGDFVIENNTFKTSFTQGGPIYLGRYASSTPVVVKDNTFETVSSLDEAMYVQDHSNYGVSINASNNTFGN